jgi:hypothetical protein
MSRYTAYTRIYAYSHNCIHKPCLHTHIQASKYTDVYTYAHTNLSEVVVQTFADGTVFAGKVAMHTYTHTYFHALR